LINNKPSLLGTTIVARLRFVFVVLFILLLILTLTYSYLSYKTSETQGSVVESAIPDLVNAHQLETNFRELRALLDEFRQVQKFPELPPLSVSVREKLKTIEQGFAQIKTISEYHDGVYTPSMVLENLQRLFDAREQFQTALITTNRNLKDLIAKFYKAKLQLDETVKPKIIELSLKHDEYLSNLAGPINQGDKSVLNRLAESIAQLSLLLTRNTSALDQAIGLAESPLSPLSAERTRQLKFSLHRATETLIHIDEDDLKKTLAEFTANIYALSFKNGGIDDNIKSYQRLMSSYQKAEKADNEFISELSNVIEITAISTAAKVQAASDDYLDSLKLTLVTSIIVAILVVMIIWSVNRFIIENQIHERMSSLTNSVLSIARQDTDHQVTVQGSDEIGAIANALSVFKENILELQRSNNELQQFAYAASHDLKSPLTAISSLAEWIAEDTQDILPDESRENLDLLRGRINRLASLQNALLEYAKAGNTNESMILCEPHRMVADIAELLSPRDNFRIIYDSPEIKVMTIWTPLYQILTNLIANAIKHHNKSKGIIRVRVERQPKFLRVSVSDDGPGVEPKYHAEIFGLFKRLQSQDIVEGSGLGLALVKKLVNRYGGQIDIVSDPPKSRGATFTFTWPFENVRLV
jgi:signal transduction histidine kinase